MPVFLSTSYESILNVMQEINEQTLQESLGLIVKSFVSSINLCYNCCLKLVNSGRRVEILPLSFAKREACMSKITEQVEVIVQPIMEDLNFELVDVEYVKEGRDHFLESLLIKKVA